ncbi:MAG: transketolase [Desulfuromonadaceae bacterium GWC2_58_13]|nr:MAG: transketolase [Desulfuromonadaceae bacterium GWC2_58_13]
MELKTIACRVRRSALQMIYHAGSGHPGGSLSPAEILTWLYARELGLDPARIDAPDRNRFVLSKGHGCPALYAVARHVGLLDPGQLSGFRKIDRDLQGHPNIGTTPWVETSTGSLGQGFSAAIGIALGLRHQQIAARTYVLLGDGELQEGEIWEGAMFAAHYHLDNLCAIIDYNKMQSDDLNANIMMLEPLREKWSAFGWQVIEIDGHDFGQIEKAFGEARETRGKPTVIVANTIKGQGISYMAGNPLWHGSVKLKPEELVRALRDLQTPEIDIEGYVNGSIW